MGTQKSKSAARCVDPLSRSSATAEIHVDEDGIWNAMLNLTDITYGQLGNNKYYSIQLIKDCGVYKVFRKWGRVGAANPQSSMQSFGFALDSAKAAFQKVFTSKSANSWPIEGEFVKKKGKYSLVELADDESEEEGDANEEDKENDSTQAGMPPCSLPDQVQDLLKLICDTNIIAHEVSALNFDLKRMPLGRLSKAQISRGYTILQQLSDALTAIHDIEHPQASLPPSTPAAAAAAPAATTGRTTRRRATAAAAAPTATAAASGTTTKRTAKSKTSKADKTRLAQLKASLKTLTSDFYTLIPHDFGRNLPTLLDTMEAVKSKLDLLQVLADIEISQSLQKEEKKKKTTAAANPLEAQYNMINTDMVPLDEKSDEFQRIARFLQTTQAPGQSSFNIKVQSILKIARPSEQQKRDYFEDLDNHRLLWHGSRLSNVVGILSQGLRIAPPEAPANGYNFGKGIYFADSVTKSAQYCWTAPSRPRAVLLVAEVALGKSYEAPHPEYLDFKGVQAKGCSSTLGVGNLAPREETFEQMEDGVVVPIGQIAARNKGGMMFNEFIVYKQEQVRLRYLITTEFQYSSRSGFY